MKKRTRTLILVVASILGIIITAILTQHEDTIHADEVSYISSSLELTPKVLVVVEDELDRLFDKFEVKIEYRDYFRQLCELYNVDPTWAISVAQIETHNGQIKGYNVRSEDRMYYTWDKHLQAYIKTWDIGYFQQSDFYSDYWEECFFNPELIFSLGYVRTRFDLTDDIISIQVGISYLDWLLKYYKGDQDKATMSYNAGLVKVNNNNIPDITYKYAHAIKNNWKYREKDV